MTYLKNTADFSAMLKDNPINLKTQNIVKISDINIDLIKESNSYIWRGSFLEYTIQIVNNENYDIVDLVIEDTIDINVVEFLTDSIKSDSEDLTDNYTFDDLTGKLVIGSNIGLIVKAQTITIIKYYVKRIKEEA